jgi:hypothetical protein
VVACRRPPKAADRDDRVQTIDGVIPIAIVTALLGALVGGFITHRFTLSRERQKAKALRRRYLSALVAEIDYCAKLATTYLTAGIASPLYRFPKTAYETVYATLLSDVLTEADVAALTAFYSQVEQMNRGLDTLDNHRIAGDDEQVRIELLRLRAKAAEMAAAEGLRQPAESGFYIAAIGAVRAHLESPSHG